jgi:Tfp pilus assembly protein PilF
MVKRLICALMTAALAGCAGAPPVSDASAFDDAAFAAPGEVIDPDIFALSPEMRAYLETTIGPMVRHKGTRRGLFEALSKDLRIEYDAAETRTAAQTFAAHSGNCLSLVILTAAFAKELHIRVTYESVRGYETWSRDEGLAFHNGHVNIVLGTAPFGGMRLADNEPPMTIDFVPPSESLTRYSQSIREDVVVAMFLNNRAAEILAAGDVERAYWWARAAVAASPAFLSSYNTLAVVYQRHGDLPDAERALRYVLARQPENTKVLSNLAGLVAQQGRADEAAKLRAQVAEIEPIPPFYYLDRGLEALRRDDNRSALDLLEKELERMPYDDEVHLAMAVADMRLGNPDEAKHHLALAMENATTRSQHDIYAAKLRQLKAAQPKD